jgi:hypothetical protein
MNVFRDFCEMICADIEMNKIDGTKDHHFFIWYNLSAHHTGYTHETVTNRAGPLRFLIVPRLQYYPKFRPIEYTVCELTLRLRIKKEADWDMDNCKMQISEIAMSIGSFDNTFLHCQHQW